jgi:hypothetical protein
VQFRRRAVEKREDNLSRGAASAKQRSGMCGFAQLLCIPVQCRAEGALDRHASQIENLNVILVKRATCRWERRRRGKWWWWKCLHKQLIRLIKPKSKINRK